MTDNTTPYEIVAYMHDGEGRVDCIHSQVRDLWKKVSPERVARFTIPLIRLPQRKPMLTDRAKELMRETLGVENISDGNLIKLLRAIEAELE